MFLKSSATVIIWFYFITLKLKFCLSYAIVHPDIVQEVDFGKTAILHCPSSDKDHNFMFWQLSNQKKSVIGPGNPYDRHKYEYEILTGKLIIRNVHTEEEGLFNCVSKGVRDDDIKIRTVRMIVKKDWEEEYEEDPSINALRVVILLGMIIIIAGGGFLLYKNLPTKHHRSDIEMYSAVDDEDDDESNDEVFSKPGPSYQRSKSKSFSPFRKEPSPKKIETKGEKNNQFDPFADDVPLATAFNSDFKFP